MINNFVIDFPVILRHPLLKTSTLWYLLKLNCVSNILTEAFSPNLKYATYQGFKLELEMKEGYIKTIARKQGGHSLR